LLYIYFGIIIFTAIIVKFFISILKKKKDFTFKSIIITRGILLVCLLLRWFILDNIDHIYSLIINNISAIVAIPSIFISDVMYIDVDRNNTVGEKEYFTKK